MNYDCYQYFIGMIISGDQSVLSDSLSSQLWSCHVLWYNCGLCHVMCHQKGSCFSLVECVCLHSGCGYLLLWFWLMSLCVMWCHMMSC